MNTTLEQKKKEAVIRMETLGLAPFVIDSFKKDEGLYFSEDCKNKTVLNWADMDPDINFLVEKFQTEYNALVYHVHLGHTVFGDLFSLFFVSDSSEEWPVDRKEAKEGFPIVYVYNMYEGIHEFGSIQVKKRKGGMHRLG